jgi:hypothetical protein
MAQEEKVDSSSFNQDDLPGRCRYVHVKLAFKYRLKGIYQEIFPKYQDVHIQYSYDDFG